MSFYTILLIFEACSSQIMNEPVYVRKPSFIPRVVNGRPAELGDVPYQIAFKLQPIGPKDPDEEIFYYTKCGGTLIGPSKIVSAAHCFKTRKSGCFKESIVQEAKEVSRYMAVAGTLVNFEDYNGTSYSTSAQWRSLHSVTCPSDYKFPRFDLAVVMTQEPFQLNAYVAPITFATRYIDYQGECLVSGFGRTGSPNSNKMIRSNKLLLANLEILPLYYCSRLHNRNMRKFICTIGKIADVGKGDSGGPLICKNTGEELEGPRGILVGIVSGKRKFSNRRRTAGTFFTRVSSFSDYIQRNAATSHKSLTICKISILLYCLRYSVFFICH